MNALLDILVKIVGSLARWAAAHWRALLTVLSAGVLLLVASRLLLPLWAFGSMTRQLQSSFLPPPAALLLAATAAAVLVALHPPVVRWLLRGSHRREAAAAVMATAVVAALPTLLQGNFGADGTSRKWVKRNDDGTLDTSMREFDPATGDRLEPLTKALARQIERQNRRKPRLVNRPVCEIDFFDGGTGLPQVWWGERPNGTARLFDAPGHDPQTGKVLAPVEAAQVDAWTTSCPRR